MNILPISVLIPTMNRPESLKRTLDNYLAANSVPSQIVIVDQSTGKLRSEVQDVIAQRAHMTKIDYFYQSTPSSTIARNTAFEQASEEIVIYSDDDVDVKHDTLQTVYDIFSDNKVAMVAGMNDLSPVERSKIGYLLGTKSFKNRFTGHVTRSVLGRFPLDLSGQTPTSWAMGFFFAVRRSLVKAYNIRWDENLIGYAYAEDLDYTMTYCTLAKKNGLRCVFDSRIYVSHLGSLEYRVPSEKSIYSYCVNRRYISFKHKLGASSRLAILWCDVCMLALRFLQHKQPGVFLRALVYATFHQSELAKGIVRYPFS